jgi:hypothetical protein
MKKTRVLIAIVVLVLSLSCSISTPAPSFGSIRGILWHEICKFTGGQGGEPVVLGEGCVQWGSAPE